MLKKCTALVIPLLIFLISVQAAYAQAPAAQKPQGKLFGDEGTTESEYLMSIERAGQVLQSAYIDAEFSGGMYRLFGEIDHTKGKLNLIIKSLKDASPNVRNQQMYHIVLLELQHELEEQNKVINTGNENLEKIKDRVAALRKDTVLFGLIKDTIKRKQYRIELQNLKKKYKGADSLMNVNMAVLSAKKRLTVERKLEVSNALLMVEERLEKSGISLFKAEYPNFWQSSTVIDKKELSANIKGKFEIEAAAANYYTSYSFSGLVVLVFFMALLTWYVVRNLNYIKRGGHVKNLELFGFKYLNRGIVLPILVIALNIAVVTNLYAPAMFIELLQFILLVVLSLLFKKDWSKKSMRNWLLLILLFTTLCFLDLFIKVSLPERCVFMVINIFGIRYGLVQLKSIKDQLYIKGFFKWAAFIFISLNALALLFNLFGRVSLSHMISLTAILALTQIIALSVLLKIILEIILLQIYTTRIKRGIETIFDHESLSDNLKRPFVLLISYMWMVVISSNLNIYEALHTSIGALVTRPITIGSITFTLGGILLFIVIIWLAHLLQKYVAYFFGEIDNDTDEENINKRQHSKLLVTRLIVLIVGYLIAIAASGMPMDKLSIVIGALGVGIGLGLQNIVNNFVSGVILIFDKPIQVGDIIEVSAQSGRVKSMGLRTTKINAPNGAEIIIPNGNILSQNITNWTYTDNLKLVEISFSITGDVAPEAINDILTEALKTVPLADATKPPQIYYSAISNGNYKLLVKFWCSIYRTDETISNARQVLFRSFTDAGVAFTS
jgi:small-conductance mechanosensitive channel